MESVCTQYDFVSKVTKQKRARKKDEVLVTILVIVGRTKKMCVSAVLA